ncbi:hypothetical protein Rhal01_03208 [Rubritalea halochordaticola]|uniref:Uncharacterized protein n=2 Tax=Rubritalea halochordaticola TaxID=714537 RepID=A0ABP9V4T2_9BACT
MHICAAEKKVQLLSKPDQAYQNQTARSGLVALSVYPLGVVKDIEGFKKAIRITRVGDWGKNESLMLAQNENGYALYKREQRIIEHKDLAIVLKKRKLTDKEMLVASRKIDRFINDVTNNELMKEAGNINYDVSNNTPFFLVEDMSGDDYRAILISPKNYIHIHEKAEGLIGYFNELLR